MSVNVNLYFKVSKLQEEVAADVRKAIEQCLEANGMNGDVYDIEGIKYKDDTARLFFGNDWSKPLSLSGAKETLDRLERDLRAAISKHQPEYEFELVIKFPDEA